jgi:hypothetical protein
VHRQAVLGKDKPVLLETEFFVTIKMPKPRRRPPRRLSDLSRLVVPLGAGLALLLSLWGFVHFTRIALYKQAHFAPDSVHPDDGYAAFCLFLGMAALAFLLLSLRDPPPMRWRRRRRIQRPERAKAKPKRARRSGTIEG